MFKPTRGAQRAAAATVGISPFALIRFFEQAQGKCLQEGDKDSALKFELMAEYFQKDYEPGKPLRFDGNVIGY